VPVSEIYKKVKTIKPQSIAVIGDIILDHYLSGDITRISPEAPVRILDCKDEEYRLGGAANVAGNLAKLGCKISLIGIAGTDASAKNLKKLLKKERIDSSGIFAVADRPTIKKTRLMSQGQQLMRIDREVREPLPSVVEKKILAFLNRKIKKLSGLIISDYEKGLLTKSLLAKIISIAHKNKKVVVVDPKGLSFAKYKGADFITPNRLELEKASGMTCKDRNSIIKAGKSIMATCKVKSVLATLGADGMAFINSKGKATFIPTVAREVYDVTGAGDTVVATFTFALTGGLTPEDSVRLANHAGGLQVAHLGAVGIGKEEIEESFFTEVDTNSKIVNLKIAVENANQFGGKNKKTVFTNGCFDLIHYGHIKYLQKAKELGDRLVVAINSDASVKKLKGSGRPVINELDRAHVISALDCVDQVVIFSEATPLKLIRKIKPSFLVKGGDYKIADVVGHKDVGRWGGVVKIIPYESGKSTSKIISKIKESN